MKAYDWRYKFLKAKAYFEKGYGLTHYVKYLIAYFGLSSSNVTITMFIAMGYVPVCFVLGWWWFNHGWMVREQEINNEFNWFVGEMRQSIGKEKVK